MENEAIKVEYRPTNFIAWLMVYLYKKLQVSMSAIVPKYNKLHYNNSWI